MTALSLTRPTRLPILALTAILPVLGTAVSDARAEVTLDEIARDADLVAVAIVEQTDYEKTRQFPSSGSGYLQILIPYKGVEEAGDWIEVVENGLGDEKCYYPEPDYLNFTGARFLVMLEADPNKPEVYHGVQPGCMIPVLVTSENQYAIRYPVDGLSLPEDRAQTMVFSDPVAVVDAGDYTAVQIEDLESRFKATRIEPGPYDPNFIRYQYTLGIPLSEIRDLTQLPTLPRQQPAKAPTLQAAEEPAEEEISTVEDGR